MPRDAKKVVEFSSRRNKDVTTDRVLPALNVIDVAPEGSSDETVNQRRLRNYYDLKAQFDDLRSRVIAEYAKIQDLIINGAAIQQGQYKVQYGLRYVRRPRYKQIVIDLKGEQYQKRVLENTAPHAHFRVRVQ